MVEIISKTKNPPDSVRDTHRKNSHFDPANIGAGGGLFTYVGESYNTDTYREGWDRIFGKGKSQI